MRPPATPWSADPAERGTEVANARRLRIVGVVGEHVEELAADDVLTLRHRRVEVGVAGRNDRQVRGEDEVESWRRLEKRPEVGGGKRT
jgi:hypothetical protein